jgi:hypothetical protein
LEAERTVATRFVSGRPYSCTIFSRSPTARGAAEGTEYAKQTNKHTKPTNIQTYAHHQFEEVL